MRWIFSNAIGGGQADFDQPTADLLPEDRARLYAYLNQPGHIDELQDAFGQMFAERVGLEGATIIDVGCGPFTAGLALANVGGCDSAFQYVGIDRAVSMRSLGQRLADGARAAGALHPQTSIQFAPDLATVDFGVKRAGWAVVVLSYLLASGTLDVDWLLAIIEEACARKGIGPAAVLYTNTTREGAGRLYPDLREGLVQRGFIPRVEDVAERRNRNGTERFVHYALFVRPAPDIIPIDQFRA